MCGVRGIGSVFGDGNSISAEEEATRGRLCVALTVKKALLKGAGMQRCNPSLG